jgi:hypothetical protein
MNTWPWTNIKKELMKRSEMEPTGQSFTSVDDMMNHIKSIKYPWYKSAYNYVVWTLNDWTWDVYRWLRPCHAMVRNAIPKKYSDGVELIRQVNFAIIQEFYEEESSMVDWSAHEEHQKFYSWLQHAYEYITSGRLLKEQELNQAWENIDTNKPGLSKYSHVQAIENQIEQQDDKILVEMMRNRKYFWT